MSWPYKFNLDLTHDEKHARRLVLDRYGTYAQLSALIPILAYQLYRLGVWVYSERQRAKVSYEALPSSPSLKRARKSTAGGLSRRWRATSWWLESEIAPGWGLRGQWIAVGVWMSWLMFLCVHKTGDDYFHITKRFGMIAVSQFPIHYLLSMKTRFSPIAFLFRVSHEQLNPWHRISGRVIYFLLLCHALWYLNAFVQFDILGKKISERVVIIGILAISMMTILINTSLEIVRRWSYRVFFVCHLFIGISILPLLWFHASHLRFYVAEALALFIMDFACRRLDTVTGFATITSIPDTKLVQVKIPLPASKLTRFQAAPGQHVYLSLPAESTPAKSSKLSIHNILLNPFTVASVSATDITLVLRALNGPTTQAIENLARLTKARPPTSIEGPLGSPKYFPNLAAKFDRILLVAGGVGATFILPIYRCVQEQLQEEGKSEDRVKMIWSMRSKAEASWALEAKDLASLDEDSTMKIFVTGDKEIRHRGGSSPDGTLEMDELEVVDKPLPLGPVGERADLKKIVDEIFGAGNEERIAILVCGPSGMARDVRASVGKWVEKGRDCWFHDESFGW